jgi:transposase-like protein
MESGGINVNLDEFFKDVKQTKVGRHREYTEKEKDIIVHAYENGYVLIDVADKLDTTVDTMRKFYRAYKRGENGRD